MNTSSQLESDLALAHRMADLARSISLDRFRGALKRRTKSDGSIVTDADEAVEDALRDCLRREQPADAVLGEERGLTGSGNRRWIIDGIDGTLSFAAGETQWGVLVALEINGQIVLGICEQPPVSRRYWAIRGGGAFRSNRQSSASRLFVSATSELAKARSFVPSGQWLPNEEARVRASVLSSVTQPQPADDHPALQVAGGACDVAVFFMGGPWDIAAPSIIVEEAGGKFTDLAGGTTLTHGAVFSNGRVHDAAVRITSGKP